VRLDAVDPETAGCPACGGASPVRRRPHGPGGPGGPA
jgi:hypothetical protein